jgi:hypothetical protein
MRRILLVMSVAALMAAMVAVTAVPAFATVHPLSRSDVSNAPVGTAAETQNPPGITDEGTEGNTDPDPDNALEAQPVVSVRTNPSGGTSQDAAFQDPIQ